MRQARPFADQVPSERSTLGCNPSGSPIQQPFDRHFSSAKRHRDNTATDHTANQKAQSTALLRLHFPTSVNRQLGCVERQSPMLFGVMAAGRKTGPVRRSPLRRFRSNRLGCSRPSPLDQVVFRFRRLGRIASAVPVHPPALRLSRENPVEGRRFHGVVHRRGGYRSPTSVDRESS